MPESNYIQVRQRAKDNLRQSYNDPYLDDVMAMANYHRHDVISTHLAAFYTIEPHLNPREWEEWNTFEDHRKSKDGSLEWVATNLGRLSQEFPNRFILVDNAEVVADSEDIADLLERASQLGISSPLVIDTQLPHGALRTAC